MIFQLKTVDDFHTRDPLLLRKPKKLLALSKNFTENFLIFRLNFFEI